MEPELEHRNRREAFGAFWVGPTRQQGRKMWCLQGSRVGLLSIRSLSDVWGRELIWLQRLIAATLISGLARYNLGSPRSDYGKKPIERGL